MKFIKIIAFGGRTHAPAYDSNKTANKHPHTHALARLLYIEINRILIEYSIEWIVD